MDAAIARLVDQIWHLFHRTPADQRLLIAVSGVPGSGKIYPIVEQFKDHIHSLSRTLGKTTLAARVVAALNIRHAGETKSDASADGMTIMLSLDGFHYTRAQLSAMPDSETAHARRGAAFTFDAAAYLALVKTLRRPLRPDTAACFAPSFDHAVKDPVANDITITAASRVIIFEGNYLSFGSGPVEWRQAASLMDRLWFIEVDEAVARERLIRRHLRSGLARSRAEAARRADGNDLVNGREILAGRVEVDEVVWSEEDVGVGIV